MKTPAFWYLQHPTALANMLTPFGWLYLVGGVLRRALATPYRAKVPVICIGNIVAGGAGKTPVALAFAGMLKEAGHKPVFVTRGYGGRLRGPVRVDPARHTARDVGDEALLLARVAPVWIARDRGRAIREAEKEATHVVVDDGLQNPSVLANISFLVIDGDVGFGNGRLIPAGPLRESYEGAMKRITAVILIGERVEDRMAARVQCPLLRAQYAPVLPDGFPRDKQFLAFAGIGRPEKFYATCRKAELDLVATRDFADHHMFSARELNDLKRAADAAGAQLLTTEKDWVRLPPAFQKQILKFPVTLVFDDPVSVRRIIGAGR